jgi:hypothetical protein
MIGSLGIIRIAVPDDPTKPGIWLTDSTGRNAVRLALTTGQRTDSGGGQDPLSLNGLVMPEIEVMLPPK